MGFQILSSLSVRSFKSLENIELPLENLNLLFGQNNSGKSSILQSIIYLKKAGLGGWNKNHGGSLKAKKFGFDLNDPEGLFFRDENGQREFLEIIPKISLNESDKFEDLEETAEGTDFEDIPLKECWIGARFTEQNWEPIYRASSGKGELICKKENGSLRLPRTEDAIDANFGDGYLNFGLTGDYHESNKDLVLQQIQEIAQGELEKIYYILERRMVEDWSADPKEQDFVGMKGGNTVSMLHALKDEREKFGKIIEVVSDISPDISGIKADMYGSRTRTELKDSDIERLLNLIASGSGLKRNLPIIVQAIASDRGDTLLIEEPEISLYPTTQKRLAKLLVERAHNGVQMIVTTHSAPFIRKLWNQVKDSDLNENKTKAYRTRKKGGRTETKDVGMESAVGQMEDLVITP